MPRKPADDRTVTTTELTATSAAERNALTHLAADARMLTHNTHPNLVPVVEARWLAANRLAILRAKVKGSSLRQTIDAVGPMPEPRVIEILKDVGGVLEWAARGNIVHRYVGSHGVCFQKGSGRVLVSFGLPAVLRGAGDLEQPDTSLLFERCADAATLARLAYEMLTAHQPGDASVESLEAVRPDVSAEMVAAVGAGLACLTGAPALGAQQFLAMLPGGDAPRPTVAGIATAASAPVVPKAAAVPVTPAAMPLGNDAARPVAADSDAGAKPEPVKVTTPARPDTPLRPAAPPSVGSAPPAYHAPRRRKGRGMLIASVIALLLVVGATFALIQRERGRDETRIATNAGNADAAGDVDVAATEPLPPDPGALTTDGALPDQDVGQQLPSELPSNVEQPLPGSLPSTTPPLPQSIEPSQPVPPPASSSEPVPAPVVPSPARPQQPIPGGQPEVAPPSAPVTGATGCASPAMADQRACLDDLIASSDRELTSVYQALLRSVEERQGPAAVESVRERQRAWLQRRDGACRTPAAVDGQLWARERAGCMARQSDARALELARELAAVRGE